MIQSTTDSINGNPEQPVRGILDIVGHNKLHKDDEGNPVLGVRVDALQLRYFGVLLSDFNTPLYMGLIRIGP
jgi:hypothetical protein